MKKLFFILLASVSLAGCPQLGQHWSDKKETLLVDYYKVQCDDNDDALCFRVREKSSDSWDTAPEKFNGFDSFEWGYRYQVEVETSFDRNGNPESYDFRSVVNQEAVIAGDESFSLTLYTDTGILVPVDDSNWSLNGEITFNCGSYCAEILASVNDGYITQLEFSASENLLTLTSFICSAAEDDFNSECAGESEVSWYIGHFMTDCGLAEPALCYVYKVNSSDDYELLKLDEGISGFTYEWGSRYKISVNQTLSPANVLTSAEFIEEDESPEERIGDSYSFLFIADGHAVNRSSSGVLTMYDSSESFDCGSYSQCSRINEYIEDDGDRHEPEYLLLRAYVDADRVVILDVICHQEGLTAFRSCVTDEDEREDIFWGI